MERAGVDIVSDGEQRRESYFNLLANTLEGIDLERPGVGTARTGRQIPVPHVPPARLIAAPDCGMKYLTRDVALAKLSAMVEAARALREPPAG